MIRMMGEFPSLCLLPRGRFPLVLQFLPHTLTLISFGFVFEQNLPHRNGIARPHDCLSLGTVRLSVIPAVTTVLASCPMVKFNPIIWISHRTWNVCSFSMMELLLVSWAFQMQPWVFYIEVFFSMMLSLLKRAIQQFRPASWRAGVFILTQMSCIFQKIDST